jgi:hypothetical protein
MGAYDPNPNIVLITVGHGGTTLYHGRSENLRNCQLQTYGDRWRERLDGSDPSVIIPENTPVVDCTGPECDVYGYAVSGPMFSEVLDDDQVHELGKAPFIWDGKKASGMAQVGRDVFLAHAAAYGTKITDARTGEPWPAPERLPEGIGNAKGDALALAAAANPAAAIGAVMLHGTDNALDHIGSVPLCDDCGNDVPDHELPDGSLVCAYCAGE